MTAAFSRFAAHGVRTVVGTDGYNMDLLGELNAASMISKLSSQRADVANAPELIDAVTAMAPNVAENQVRALATTGNSRSTVLANVPTAGEAGVPGYEATIWLGLMAPAGTPRPVIDKLNAAVNAAIKRPDIVRLWAGQGAAAMSMTMADSMPFLSG